MEVSYRTRELERCYTESQQATKKWGPDVGRKYITRIKELQAAITLQDIRDSHSLGFHALKGDRRGQSAIKLTGRWRLIIGVDEENGTIVIREVTNHYED